MTIANCILNLMTQGMYRRNPSINFLTPAGHHAVPLVCPLKKG